MLAMQDCKLVAERNNLELQFRSAAKPTSEPRNKRRDVREHAPETTARQDKSLDFLMLSEFSVGTEGAPHFRFGRDGQSRGLQSRASSPNPGYAAVKFASARAP